MDVDAVGHRATLSLDGLWDFEFEGPTSRLGGEGHTIRTPGIWQTQFPALRNAQGSGRYRRRVQIPADCADKSIHLIMEGVFHESVILVDEAPVAVHGDGWTPIEIDLTDVLGARPHSRLASMRGSPTTAMAGASANRSQPNRTGMASKAESGSRRVWRRAPRSTSPKLTCKPRSTSRLALCR